MAEERERLIAGQYRLVEEIGRGGFGVVWRAWDERLHRAVAAKELHLPTHLVTDEREELRLRSLREARSAARIVHPSAVTVFDVVEHHDSPWIIMEFVRGRPLNGLVRAEGPLTPRRAAEVGLAVLGALRAAHAAGVVHRDVKPGNVLIGERRTVLTDFGIATIEGDPSLTHSGFVMGAPAYTAPERARGEPAVPASDLWSLGATLFFAVEGRRPFPGENVNAVLNAVLNGDPDPLRYAGPLGPIIQGLLRREPGDRLTAEQTADLLEDVVNDRVPPLRSLPNGTPTRPVVLPARRRRPDLRRLATALAVPVTAAVAGGLLYVNGAVRADDPRATPSASRPAGPRVLRTLQAGDVVYTVVVSPDGRTLAAAGEEQTARLWSTADWRSRGTLRGHSYAIFTAAFSPDSRTLATGGYDTGVLLWDVTTGRRRARLEPDQGTIGSLAFSPDGRRLLTAGVEDVQLWDVAKVERVRTLSSGSESQFTAAFSAKDWVGLASTDSLRLYRPKAAPRDERLGTVTSLVRAMAFDARGTTMAVGGDDGRVALWDCQRGRRLGTLALPAGVYALAFSPDGRTLATGSGRDVTLWDVATRTRKATLKGSGRLVSALAFGKDSSYLAVGDHDHTIRVWSLP